MNIDKKNYQVIVNSGIIDKNYTPTDVLSKLKEELKEVEQAINNDSLENYMEELTDIIITAQNGLIHIDADIDQLKRKCYEKNNGRVR